MLNITTFLDANSKRLSKNVLYNPKTNKKYTSKEILSIVSQIGRELKTIGIEKGDRSQCKKFHWFDILSSYF